MIPEELGLPAPPTTLPRLETFIIKIKNRTNQVLKRTGVYNDSEIWPLEDIPAKTEKEAVVASSSFSFAATYALPYREIALAASYPILGQRKIDIEWSDNAKKTWNKMDDRHEKNEGGNLAYIERTSHDNTIRWIFEINE